MKAALLVLVGCGRIDFDPTPPRCEWNAPFTTITALDTLNTPDGEGGLRLSTDELVAYYHSNRGLGTAYGIFVATRTSRDEAFPLGTFSDIGGLFPSTSPDQLTLVHDGGGDGLYVKTRATTADPFPTTGPALPNVNTADVEIQPELGGSGRSLYFMRDTGAGTDLYVALWPDLTAERALTELNTAADDRVPVISADDLTIYWATVSGGKNDILYFETNRNVGDYDLYVAEREPL